MKRSPLKRKSGLRRKRPTERRSSRVRDEVYLAWVRLQPCAVLGVLASGGPPECVACVVTAQPLWRCSGPIDPEHRREGVGAGQKASDRDAWPCCRRHHEDRHALTGIFAGWKRAQLRAFIRERITEANAAYERHLAPAVLA